jgi:RecB family exonuclease
MPIHLYLAPAAGGKTNYLLNEVRQAARARQTPVRVLVSGGLQAATWRRRLAELGGALGVRVQTFHELYLDILNLSGRPYVQLSEPVQYRLLRTIVDEAPLAHYAPLKTRPGFISLLQSLIAELKAARVHPDDFQAAIAALGNEPRLAELSLLYSAYQTHLQAQQWADRAGLGWLAVETLAQDSLPPDRLGRLVVVDGFDNFTQIQIDLLQALAGLTGQLLISLTGGDTRRGLVYRRFDRTRRHLEAALGIQAEPLPAASSGRPPALAHLEARLYAEAPEKVDGSGILTLIEAPDRAAEAREALRWLKARLVQDGARPSEVALLARTIEPYRPFIAQVGAEFGLPLHFADGQPLRSNPAIAALLDLLRLVLPRAETNPEPALPRRQTVEAWRSPYFDWSALPASDAPAPIDIAPGDAVLLDAVARHGRVIGGYSHWAEAFKLLSTQTAVGNDEPEDAWVGDLPSPAAVQALAGTFTRFLQRLLPLQRATVQNYVYWLEDLIGPDPALAADSPYAPPAEPTSLNLVAQARTQPDTARRDLAALGSFKEVLRGLVWAEQALSPAWQLTYAEFFTELAGAVEAAGYMTPSQEEAILVADVIQARGVPFQAVAVLGLAEGAFPTALNEDPLLRDADRRRLNGLGLGLDLATDSAEIEFFYETVTRPWSQLCLIRPRLADNGALWQPSPYWEEVRRLVDIEPDRLGSDSAPPPDRVASWPELLESLSTYFDPQASPGYQAVWDWVGQTRPEQARILVAATELFNLRYSRSSGSPYEGHLHHLGNEFATRFSPDQTWSASRLETYRTCPFMFYIGHVLKLEPRPEPVEGLDARQLGNLYHRILERVYQTVDDPVDLEQLLAALPQVAGPILDDAPQREGFRATAWWTQTRTDIEANVRQSLIALAEKLDGYTPMAYEQAFFDQQALTVRDGDDLFRLHGYIDRVDQRPDGTIRVIDYKTGGPSPFTSRAVQEGKKLQLPLYALAARDALNLGQPADGFYWHIRHAEASSFSLQKFKATDGDNGPEAAFRTAIEKAWEVVHSARAGYFAPQPPPGGCPSYCPAATFCWHYQPGFGG